MSRRDSHSIRSSGRFTSRWPGVLLLVLLWLAPLQAFAQALQDREGVTLYWGLVPAAIVDDRHAVDELVEFVVSARVPHGETR